MSRRGDNIRKRKDGRWEGRYVVARTPDRIVIAGIMISTFGYIGAAVITLLYIAFFIVNAGGFGAYFATGWTNIVQDLVEAVSLAIVIIVCAVPEGLPLMISLVLMQNTKKMLEHNLILFVLQEIW